MKRVITSAFSLLTILFWPGAAKAQLADGSVDNPFGDLLTNILVFINETIIPFIIGIGFLAFVWGMFQYFILGGSNDESREKGRKLMIHATFAFVIIIIFFGVINLLTSSTGLEGETLKYVPSVSVPN